MKKILVVATHPDDETLGCGGTILKHAASGDEVYWCIVTSMTEEHGWDEALIRERDEGINLVSRAYSFAKVFRVDYPARMLDRISAYELISSIAEIVSEV